MSKNIVIMLGIETIRDDMGNVVKYSDTFLDNALTFKKENKKDNIRILDARSFVDEIDPIESLWKAAISSLAVIDKLVYYGHSSPESLICFSHVRTELPIEKRYFRDSFHYTGSFSKGANFTIYGCQAGGTEQKKDLESIAQVIANKIQRKVYAYTSKSYQIEKPKGSYYQISDDKIGLVEFTPI